MGVVVARQGWKFVQALDSSVTEASDGTWFFGDRQCDRSRLAKRGAALRIA